jgi:hypothetical protein
LDFNRSTPELAEIKVYLLANQWFMNGVKQIAKTHFICFCTQCPFWVSKLPTSLSIEDFAAATRIIYDWNLDEFKTYVHSSAFQKYPSLQSTQQDENCTSAWLEFLEKNMDIAADFGVEVWKFASAGNGRESLTMQAREFLHESHSKLVGCPNRSKPWLFNVSNASRSELTVPIRLLLL